MCGVVMIVYNCTREALPPYGCRICDWDVCDSCETAYKKYKVR